jgi:hypothetical protein
MSLFSINGDFFSNTLLDLEFSFDTIHDLVLSDRLDDCSAAKGFRAREKQVLQELE